MAASQMSDIYPPSSLAYTATDDAGITQLQQIEAIERCHGAKLFPSSSQSIFIMTLVATAHHYSKSQYSLASPSSACIGSRKSVQAHCLRLRRRRALHRGSRHLDRYRCRAFLRRRRGVLCSSPCLLLRRAGVHRTLYPSDHVDVAFVILLHPRVLEQLSVSPSLFRFLLQAMRMDRISVSFPSLKCPNVPLGHKVLRDIAVSIWQPRRRTMHDRLQLCKYIGIRFRRIRVTAHREFDDAQPDGPYVGRDGVCAEVVLRLALDSFGLKGDS